MMKKRSNHKESIKKGITKGYYADRARALCDPAYLNGEMQNIINVFEDNGYSRGEVEDAMKEKEREEKTERMKRNQVEE